jgi:hypothetical protein
MNTYLPPVMTPRRLRMLVSLAAVCLLARAAELAPAKQGVPENPRPSVSGFSPASVVAGSPSFTMIVVGNDFVTGAAVGFGGTSLPPRDVNGVQITVDVPSSALVQAGNRIVSVTNPPPGGGTAQAWMPFQVTAPPPTPPQP